MLEDTYFSWMCHTIYTKFRGYLIENRKINFAPTSNLVAGLYQLKYTQAVFFYFLWFKQKLFMVTNNKLGDIH